MQVRYVLAVPAVAVLISGGGHHPALAGESRAPTGGSVGLEAAKEALDRSSAKLRAAARALDRAKAQLDPVEAELVAARAQLAAAENRDDRVAAELDQAAAADRRAAERVAAARAALESAVAAIGHVANHAYQRGSAGALGELSVALDATSVDDFVDRLAMTEAASTSLNRDITKLRARRVRLAAEHDRLDGVLAQVSAARAAARAALLDKARLAVRARRAQERASRRVSDGVQALAAAEAVQRAAEARYAEMAAGESVAGSGALVIPVPGRTSSPFGPRTHPITGQRKLHAGMDIAASCGTPVRVARAGTVRSAGFSTSYGYRSVVDHGTVDGVRITTTYNHQQSLQVREGQAVARSDVIGTVGTTGYSTGCHMHFEALADGELVDPAAYL